MELGERGRRRNLELQSGGGPVGACKANDAGANGDPFVLVVHVQESKVGVKLGGVWEEAIPA